LDGLDVDVAFFLLHHDLHEFKIDLFFRDIKKLIRLNAHCFEHGELDVLELLELFNVVNMALYLFLAQTLCKSIELGAHEVRSEYMLLA
jgi:hypothetical protein